MWLPGRGGFSPFPSHHVPTRPHLTAMFNKDYWKNKSHILRELRAIVSDHSLAVDHQRKVVKCTLGGGVVGSGGQTFTICGGFGLVLGVYVVPDTALSWGKQAMAEVIERHRAAGVQVNSSLLTLYLLMTKTFPRCLLLCTWTVPAAMASPASHHQR